MLLFDYFTYWKIYYLFLPVSNEFDTTLIDLSFVFLILEKTVRGMMYYRRALMLQSYLERRSLGGICFITYLISSIFYFRECSRYILTFYLESIVDAHSQTDLPTTQGFELSRESRAQADLKFTYVVSCQIYGQQKQKKLPEAADIALLLQRYSYCCFSS